jgi:uncharacterized protein YegL
VFQRELLADPLASKRVDVAVITFGGAPQLLVDFIEAASFVPPVLTADGATPMGAAITDAIQRLQVRKQLYRANGVSYYRPWIFLITDGAPTDVYSVAAQQVRDGEARNAFSFYAVGIQEANFNKLSEIAPPSRPPAKLDGLRFGDLFQWLSHSLSDVSKSKQGSTVPLEHPGWITAQS